MSTSGELATYLDASALVKLVVAEDESAALRKALAAASARVSCSLVRVEVVRAVRHLGRRSVADARRILEGVDLLQLDDELLDLAAELDGRLRSLDAIHVAAALELGDDLEALVTYDERMALAAKAHGLPVVSPR